MTKLKESESQNIEYKESWRDDSKGESGIESWN